MWSLWDVLPEDALPVVTVIALWSCSIRSLPDGQREAAYDAQAQALYGCDAGGGGGPTPEARARFAAGRRGAAPHVRPAQPTAPQPAR